MVGEVGITGTAGLAVAVLRRRPYASVLILTLIVCVGCTREVVRYTSVPLPYPVLADLPGVSDAELECISEDARLRLEARQQQMREDLEACMAVLCTTHPECEAEE